MFSPMKGLAVAAIAGFAAFSGMANAMPVTPGPQTVSTEIVPAQYMQNMQNHKMNGGMQWQAGRDGNRCLTRFGNCRHYHQGYYYQTPWWTLPLVVGSAIADSNYDYGSYNDYGSSHVEWCLSRYRSYNPRTDMWLGNSGRYYRCVGPY